MRPTLVAGLVAAALVAVASPALGQKPDGEASVWGLGGLRTGFCIQLLLAPASELLQDLPPGVRPLPASEVADLHVSLKSVVEGQPEFASWTPSRLCFQILATIRASDFVLDDGGGRHPQLFGTWTVAAAGPADAAHEVAIELFANSARLVRSARLAGQSVREARLVLGKVPAVDENGTPSAEDRIQVKMGGTTITWDGHLAGDSAAVSAPLETAWTTRSVRGREVAGKLALTPTHSQPMAGSLKVDGKDEYAKALKASPTRFVGPAYRGGGGSVSFAR
jgi:hypothetical protein